MSREKPVVAITVGDYNGIGPEVVLKSLRHRAVRGCCQPVLVGPAEVYRFYARKLRLPLTFEHSDTATTRSTRSVRVIEPPHDEMRLEISPGTLSSDAGRIAAEAISFAVQMIQQGEPHALVTAPVSKQALHLAQVDFPGQTEMLQRLSNSPSVAMMLVSPVMRVALATIHVPLRKVSEMLSRQLLRDRILTVYDALRTDWKIRSPRLAVLGLNPHAGEGGDIG
ncbi:MAG TPA: 4-hydroxythreonine-4-phosphate dehydrogenase PdxA, partial [Bacteroidota bacterium]|nr:4-hydroxythreonine-4-phosphate dehydrogenase PdxA [Bacteroidota bacterium]